jgi:energy-coupling factor transporter ATP-binding protein EcfA2
MRLTSVWIERAASLDGVLDLDVHGLVPLEGITVLFGANGSGKSRALELVESLLAPESSYVGRRSRLTDDGEDRHVEGRVHLVLERLDESGGDWEWLRRVVMNLEPAAPNGGIPGLVELATNWRGANEPVEFNDRTDRVFNTYGDFRAALQRYGIEEQQYMSLAGGLLTLLSQDEPEKLGKGAWALVLFLTLLQSDRLELSFQSHISGRVAVLWRPGVVPDEAKALEELRGIQDS